MLYKFGNARLDIMRRQLLHNGIERPLTPKAFDLLRLLIELRPRVVSKAEIMDLIWPDAFVAEANVGILIGDIRAAIGDVPAKAQMIRTHHGVGYSFAGEVLEQTRDAAVPLGGTIFVLMIGERRIVLARGELIVGRDVQCDVIVPDQSVSRRHARIDVTPSTADIEDLHSKNGTRVNGETITAKTRLADGAIVMLGSAVTSVQSLRADGSSTLTLNQG